MKIPSFGPDELALKEQEQESYGLRWRRQNQDALGSYTSKQRMYSEVQVF